VSFSLDTANSVNNAAGSFSTSGSCTLAQVGSTTTSTCSVTYTPSAAAGTHRVTGSYQGSALHATSSGYSNVTATKRSTSTSVVCSTPVSLNQGSTCTATVSDTDSGTKSYPQGTVSFSLDTANSVNNAAGSFSTSGSCTLAQVGSTTTSSCSVTYTPSAAAGTHRVTGSYQGSSLHATSSGYFNITVNLRSTSTSVSCSDATLPTWNTTTCTATVTDTGNGTKSSPAGTVTFSNGGASGSFSPSASCTLAAGANGTSSCSVSYKPTGPANTTQTIKATYTPTDNVHAGSADSTGFQLSLTLRQGTVAYIGPTLAVTSGSSSTTAQLALSASVTDPNPAGDSVANSTVTFTDVLSGKVLASGVKVSLVNNSDTSTGTANTIVTLSTGQYGAQEYLIQVKLVPGDYTNSVQLGDATAAKCADSTSKTSCAYADVFAMIPPTTNSIQGGASLSSTGSAPAGTYADATGVGYSVGMSYNKGGTNPQGQVLLTLPRSDGYTYYVKSNSISSLAFSNSNSADGSLPKDVTIYTKASIFKVNNVTGATVSVDGNVTLRVDAHEGCTTNSTSKSTCMTVGGDKIGFTVLSSKNSALYYSNNWVYDDPSKSYRTVPQPVTGPGSNIGCAVSIN
jgi:hypothetical protein